MIFWNHFFFLKFSVPNKFRLLFEKLSVVSVQMHTFTEWSSQWNNSRIESITSTSSGAQHTRNRGSFKQRWKYKPANEYRKSRHNICTTFTHYRWLLCKWTFGMDRFLFCLHKYFNFTISNWKHFLKKFFGLSFKQLVFQFTSMLHKFLFENHKYVRNSRAWFNSGRKT